MNKIIKQRYLYIGILIILLFAVMKSPIISKAGSTEIIEIGDEISGVCKSDSFNYYKFTIPEKMKIKITVSVNPYIPDNLRYDWEELKEANVTCYLEEVSDWEDIKVWSVDPGETKDNTFKLEPGKYILSMVGCYDFKFNYKVNFKDITVYTNTEKITIPSKSSIWIGNTKKLKLNLTPKNSHNKGIVWKTSNAKIATVSDDGVVKGISQGNCTISAVLKGGNTAKCTVTVKKKPPLYIKGAGFSMNFLDGVEPYITLQNNFGKSIKYIYFNTYYYNGVGDPAYCQIQRTNYQRLQITGEIKSGTMDTYGWNAVIYNSSTRKMYIKSAEVIFMDGSKRTVSIKKSYK